VDLVLRAASLGRMERWVRHRAKAGGLFSPAAVHLISNTSGLGVQVSECDSFLFPGEFGTGGEKPVGTHGEN
jgi:hypothetical protein